MKSLIISDIHANLAGLDAVLEAERNWDEVIFLGDAIVAGPQPDQVLRRLAPLKGVWTAGNHDLEPFARVFADRETDPDQIYMRWTRDQISPEGRRVIDRLEPTHVIERHGLVIRLHHGHFPRPVGRSARPAPSGLLWRALRKIRRKLVGPDWDSRIWPDTSPRIFRAIAQEYPEPYILLAHSHVQFRVQVGSTVFINPGSVGQPRLGQPLATYAVLEDGEIDLRAVPYDVEATCRALDSVPLERSFIEAWQAGYRAGRLPARYPLRDWQSLINQGYR
jgi:predicted phosphodiesterase